MRSLSLLLICYLIKGTIQYPLTYKHDHTYQEQSEASCQLMDSFSILIQLCLAFTALLTLLYKRSQESPQRPLQIWCVIYVINTYKSYIYNYNRALDVSKQFIGAGMVHFINIAISNYAANNTTSNQCVWYFLNVAIDTTFGVFMLWCWFTILLGALDKFYIDIGETGDYGPPPFQQMIWPWLRQTTVFLFAVILTKTCLYGIVINSPWLFWLAEICIESILFISNSPRSQVVFVMLM
jgi:hypothetical protein